MIYQFINDEFNDKLKMNISFAAEIVNTSVESTSYFEVNHSPTSLLILTSDPWH